MPPHSGDSPQFGAETHGGGAVRVQCSVVLGRRDQPGAPPSGFTEMHGEAGREHGTRIEADLQGWTAPGTILGADGEKQK